jgi:hypothetical protein
MNIIMICMIQTTGSVETPPLTPLATLAAATNLVAAAMEVVVGAAKAPM